jgi:hypothetical protein
MITNITYLLQELNITPIRVTTQLIKKAVVIKLVIPHKDKLLFISIKGMEKSIGYCRAVIMMKENSFGALNTVALSETKFTKYTLNEIRDSLKENLEVGTVLDGFRQTVIEDLHTFVLKKGEFHLKLVVHKHASYIKSWLEEVATDLLNDYIPPKNLVRLAIIDLDFTRFYYAYTVKFKALVKRVREYTKALDLPVITAKEIKYLLERYHYFFASLYD